MASKGWTSWHSRFVIFFRLLLFLLKQRSMWDSMLFQDGPSCSLFYVNQWYFHIYWSLYSSCASHADCSVLHWPRHGLYWDSYQMFFIIQVKDPPNLFTVTAGSHTKVFSPAPFTPSIQLWSPILCQWMRWGDRSISSRRFTRQKTLRVRTNSEDEQITPHHIHHFSLVAMGTSTPANINEIFMSQCQQERATLS